MDKIILEENASNECFFGQSVCLTLDYYFGEAPDHPLLFLGMSSGMLLIRGLANREMLPKILMGTKKTTEKPKPENKIQSKKLKEKIDKQNLDRENAEKQKRI